jgi:hypothetical protein
MDWVEKDGDEFQLVLESDPDLARLIARANPSPTAKAIDVGKRALESMRDSVEEWKSFAKLAATRILKPGRASGRAEGDDGESETPPARHSRRRRE